MDFTTAGATTPAPAVLPDRLGAALASPRQAPTWESVIGAYLAEVGARTGSARTPAEYARYLGRFLALVGDPAAATPAHVHAFAYGAGPSGKVPAPSTVNVRLAALKGFYDFARRMRLVADNPAADVRRPKDRTPAPRGLSPDELQALLAAIPATPAGARDRAIIVAAVLTGLRRAELLGMRAGDLAPDATGAVFYRVRAKGGVQRHREMPPPAVAAIRQALAARGATLESLPPDAPLFDVSHQGFYANLRRYAKKAGLAGVTPHVLRHSAAKLRRQSGASIEDVGALLGHRNLFTTARYLARMEGERDTGWHGVAAALGVT